MVERGSVESGVLLLAVAFEYELLLFIADDVIGKRLVGLVVDVVI
jgi:hypothetical protein